VEESASEAIHSVLERIHLSLHSCICARLQERANYQKQSHLNMEVTIKSQRRNEPSQDLAGKFRF